MNLPSVAAAFLTLFLLAPSGSAEEPVPAAPPPFVAPPADIQPLGGLSLEQEWVVAHIRPHARQLAWQKRGLISFIHFGMNTFTGREWGTGDEDPALFAPSALDAAQWVAACAAAGSREVILTCKHHDGFCLWPSRYTAHTVAHSPWRAGTGDVVREVADACHAAGLAFGIYLSPADLHAIRLGVYGATAVRPRSIPTPVAGWTPASAVRLTGEWDEYNTYFMNQLFELLTEYGPVDEVWLDGANPRDIGQAYAYADWYRLVRALQPQALIFGKGPDCRWIGNERGDTRPDEWSVIPTTPDEAFADRRGADLGSRAACAGASAFMWYPGEVDVSIRPGWFFHPGEDRRLRTLDRLVDIWMGAVGGNAVMLLNAPPGPGGLLAPGDVQRLGELGRVVAATFAVDLAQGATVVADHELPDHPATFALGGRADTCWRPADWQRSAALVVSLPRAQRFDTIDLREDVAHFGQRVERFAIDVWEDGQWRQLAERGTIGFRRVVRVPAVESAQLRVRFLAARVCPTLAHLSLHLAPPRPPAPRVVRGPGGLITISVEPAGAPIRYTLDGNAPDAGAALYAGPFALPRGGVVQAMLADAGDPQALAAPPLARVEFGPAKAGWRVLTTTGEQPDGAATNAIDDDPATVWRSAAQDAPITALPARIVLDLGEAFDIAGLTMLPYAPGPWPRAYTCSTSRDGQEWTPAAAAEFANLANNPVLQTIPFPPRRARYVQLVVTSEALGRGAIAIAELDVRVK